MFRMPSSCPCAYCAESLGGSVGTGTLEQDLPRTANQTRVRLPPRGVVPLPAVPPSGASRTRGCPWSANRHTSSPNVLTSTKTVPLLFQTRNLPWCKWMPAWRIKTSARRSNKGLTRSSSHRKGSHRKWTLTLLPTHPGCLLKATGASTGRLAHPLLLVTLFSDSLCHRPNRTWKVRNRTTSRTG